jgi:hypothetical protein
MLQGSLRLIGNHLRLLAFNADPRLGYHSAPGMLGRSYDTGLDAVATFDGLSQRK